MVTKLNNAVAVVLLLVAIAAVLPVAGIYSNATCTWDTSTQTVTSRVDNRAMPGLALLVRSGDAAVTSALRADLIAGLAARGVTDVADNPVTWPRADVTVVDISGRYTPFYAPLTMRAKVVLDRSKGDPRGHVVDATVEVTGRCTGLVGKEAWMAGPGGHLATAIVALLTGPLPAR